MELAIAAAVVGTGFQAVGSIMQGQEASRAAEFESEQKKREEQEYKIAAAQAETQRRNHLTSSLETILSIRAGRGVGEASPTALASFDEIISDEGRDIRTDRLNYLSRAESARMAGDMAAGKAKTSLLAGYLTAGSEIASTGSKIFSGRVGSYSAYGSTGKAGR